MTAAPPPPTRFPEFVAAGSPRAIGQAIGEGFRESIRGLCEITLERFNLAAAVPVTAARADEVVAAAIPHAEAFLPDAMAELRATAAAAGVPFERLMLLNVRSALAAPATPATSAGEGCTSVMIGAGLAASGIGFAGQNWDNDPAMDGYSAVVTRRPTGKPAFMSWCQPGVIAYMGLSDAGFGLCLNALNGPSRRDGVGWYFMVRAIFEQTRTADIIELIGRARRAMSANAALITPDGPLDLEIMPDSVELLRAGPDEALVHTNHCLHERLRANNEHYAAAIYGGSFDRKARAEQLLAGKDRVSVEDLQALLADRQGYPGSINRYPGDDPRTGFQRSVVSLIVEPAAGRMHVTRGNPGDMPYEVYRLD
jgi:isopenicillin-N N-acyltransferase-like protein